MVSDWELTPEVSKRLFGYASAKLKKMKLTLIHKTVAMSFTLSHYQGVCTSGNVHLFFSISKTGGVVCILHCIDEGSKGYVRFEHNLASGMFRGNPPEFLKNSAVKFLATVKLMVDLGMLDFVDTGRSRHAMLDRKPLT